MTTPPQISVDQFFTCCWVLTAHRVFPPPRVYIPFFSHVHRPEICRLWGCVLKIPPLSINVFPFFVGVGLLSFV